MEHHVIRVIDLVQDQRLTTRRPPENDPKSHRNAMKCLSQTLPTSRPAIFSSWSLESCSSQRSFTLVKK